MASVVSSDYRKYSNQDLCNMIDELYKREVIGNIEREKYMDSIFKRRHVKLTTNEERKEAQKHNALQWYYRKKLIKQYNDSI